MLIGDVKKPLSAEVHKEWKKQKKIHDVWCVWLLFEQPKGAALTSQQWDFWEHFRGGTECLF
jgi:hypothetical protein